MSNFRASIPRSAVKYGKGASTGRPTVRTLERPSLSYFCRFCITYVYYFYHMGIWIL
ncbi:hypothetical protein Scep_001264 [Stephania cephalantha]|uniref:Uncharacterized protein n=1 Tax=Stephania cephalantha TaxID=152367 RepID=A0AAP0Q3S9_9MAGN